MKDRWREDRIEFTMKRLAEKGGAIAFSDWRYVQHDAVVLGQFGLVPEDALA